MVLSASGAIHFRAHGRSRTFLGIACRRPSAAALSGGRSLRQRPARLPGTQGKLPGDTGASAAGMNGFPVHEIVGEVLASRHPDHRQGDRVVGWASGFDGLMARVIADGDGLAPYDPSLAPGLAIGLQPLACVLYAIEQLPDLAGRRVAVIGQGSIGLLFSYAAKAAGAAHVTGVDPVDREAIGTGLRRRHRGARD